MNLADLQAAIYVLYNPSGKQTEVIQQAQNFCDQFMIIHGIDIKGFFALFIACKD